MTQFTPLTEIPPELRQDYEQMKAFYAQLLPDKGEYTETDYLQAINSARLAEANLAVLFATVFER